MDRKPTSMEDVLIEFLADQDATCPVCAYSLRGLQSARCPECGASLEPRLTSANIRLGPWLTGVLAMAIPFGFSAGLSILSLILMFTLGGNRTERHMLIVSPIAAVIYGIGLAVVVRIRRTFNRSDPDRQWGMTSVWLLGAALSYVIFLTILLNG